jgi:hypothetical protein
VAQTNRGQPPKARHDGTVNVLGSLRGSSEAEETKGKVLKIADLITSGEILSCLTVDEVTEELIGLLNKLDVETQKKVMARICSFLDSLIK